MRVVLDTNVVVSAALRPSGSSFHILELVAERVLHLRLSPAILAEYREVLGRPRIGIAPARVRALLSALSTLGETVVPGEAVVASPDPDDNKFLECAQAAKAHYLITGNIKHFPERWKYTKVVTPKQFCELPGIQPRKGRP